MEERTEGWAAGLQLAALSLQQWDNPADFITSFSAYDRYIFDYFTAEMVQRGISFLAISLLLGRGHWEATQMAFILCGWIMTFYARTVLFQVNDGVTEEARTGTLEQMYMSPISSSFLLLGQRFVQHATCCSFCAKNFSTSLRIF